MKKLNNRLKIFSSQITYKILLRKGKALKEIGIKQITKTNTFNFCKIFMRPTKNKSKWKKKRKKSNKKSIKRSKKSWDSQTYRVSFTISWKRKLLDNL